MENIKSAISLLAAVRSTMDAISVVGIENQDKFVGCANAIQTVSQTLGKFLQDSEKPAVLQEGGTAKELTGQEANHGE